MDHLTDIQLNEYLDNILHPSTRRAAETHLQSCAECRARLDEIQFVFTSLAEMPEARLAHDLSANVLARLPQSAAFLPQKQPRIWTSFFAAQVGAALGAFFWLVLQAVNFITPVISGFRFPQFAAPSLQLSITNFKFPNFYFLFSIFISLFSTPNLPTFQPSTFNLPTLNLSAFNTTLITISALALWVIGNATLLRNRREV